jgi:hypothetical protein
VDNAAEWPNEFGTLSKEQLKTLSIGLIGSDELGLRGWLRERGGMPGRIRVLTKPPTPPILDRSTLHLTFANSDYFTARTFAELARVERETNHGLLKQSFPDRWSAAQTRFSNKCVPYHVSAQAIITCRVPEGSRYLLLASVNNKNPALTTGWVATMAEQMWAPDRTIEGDPWWSQCARSFTDKLADAATRTGDAHIRDALSRGLSEEFNIDDKKDLSH